MTETPILTLLQRIDRALLAEIDVIREGRFQELREVQQETVDAMRLLDGMRGELRAPDLDKAAVETAMGAVNQRAAQARGLIGAALHGARDARKRLDSLMQADGQIGAYDRSGGQVTMKTIGSPYNKTI